jgi:hypothetical protein
MSMKSDVHPARFRHKVDVGPRTTHDVLEVALFGSYLFDGRVVHIHVSTASLRFSESGNWLSPRHFAENAALGIDVVHFASVVYDWCLPCMDTVGPWTLESSNRR